MDSILRALLILQSIQEFLDSQDIFTNLKQNYILGHCKTFWNLPQYLLPTFFMKLSYDDNMKIYQISFASVSVPVSDEGRSNSFFLNNAP